MSAAWVLACEAALKTDLAYANTRFRLKKKGSRIGLPGEALNVGWKGVAARAVNRLEVVTRRKVRRRPRFPVAGEVVDVEDGEIRKHRQRRAMDVSPPCWSVGEDLSKSMDEEGCKGLG